MPRYIVPDTCTIAAALFRERYTANAAVMLDAIRHRTVDALAPEVGLWEFLNVCRKKLDSRFTNPVASPADADAAVSDFRSLDILWVGILRCRLRLKVAAIQIGPGHFRTQHPTVHRALHTPLCR